MLDIGRSRNPSKYSQRTIKPEDFHIFIRFFVFTETADYTIIVSFCVEEFCFQQTNKSETYF